MRINKIPNPRKIVYISPEIFAIKIPTFYISPFGKGERP